VSTASGKGETMSENLMEGLIRQMNRCRKLVKEYEAIGPVGIFGKTMIEQTIKNAEKAMGNGDITEMVAAYKALEGCQ
jgi:hypothetical protein